MLASSHTADAGVSNEGLLGVANTKGGDEDVSDFFNNLISRLTVRSYVWNANLDWESDCPPGCQVGK
jgi:hypothetical protein